MKKPEALSPAEEAEVDRLVARGRNRIAARQKVVEDRFRRGAVPGDQEAGGGGGNRLLPRSDQRLGSNVRHVPTLEHVDDGYLTESR